MADIHELLEAFTTQLRKTANPSEEMLGYARLGFMKGYDARLADEVEPFAAWPPLPSGTLVRTFRPNETLRRDWTPVGWASRQWGVEGPIITHHDSHGLCYEVRHPDGTIGWYDPSELGIVLKKT